MKTTKKTTTAKDFKALICNPINGGLDFVYGLSTDKTGDSWQRFIQEGYGYEVKITEEEYKKLKLKTDITFHYNKYGVEFDEKFYY